VSCDVFADEQRQLPDLSYHVLDIAAEIEDRSGAAAKDRERFLTLVRALERLGTPMPLPEELREAQRSAA
jgi:hypothetical protein